MQTLEIVARVLYELSAYPQSTEVPFDSLSRYEQDRWWYRAAAFKDALAMHKLIFMKLPEKTKHEILLEENYKHVVRGE